MTFPAKYQILAKATYKNAPYSIVPIRYEDRFKIMKWRNEQLYHLRQLKPLTESEQNKYFDEVVSKLFYQKDPSQLLFSYLHEQQCMGYGGLVHINWTDKNAEVSFIMNTDFEKEYFKLHWTNFLKLLEQVAFKELGLHKVYVYAFDLRPHLYPVLESAGYFRDAILKEHCLFNEHYRDVVIHAKFNCE